MGNAVTMFVPSVGLSPAEQAKVDRTQDAVCTALREECIPGRMQWRGVDDLIRLCPYDPYDRPKPSVFEMTREEFNALSDGDFVAALKRQLLSLHK